MGMSSFPLTYRLICFYVSRCLKPLFLTFSHQSIGIWTMLRRQYPGTTTATAPWTPRSWRWNICCAWRTYISPWKSCGRGWKSWRKAPEGARGAGKWLWEHGDSIWWEKSYGDIIWWIGADMWRSMRNLWRVHDKWWKSWWFKGLMH